MSRGSRMAADLVSGAVGRIDFPDDACRRLYERAKDEQWNVDRDVAWDGLDLTQLGPAVGRAMASVYSQIQFGEVVALNAAARAMTLAPGLWAKVFGATQVMDEARHVEFFSRVLAATGEPVAVAQGLRGFADEIDAADSFEELLLGTQVILEGFAQAVFQEGIRLGRTVNDRIALPGSRAAASLLESIDARVGNDESRHIAFGVLALRARLPDLDRASRERLAARAVAWSDAITGSILEIGGPLRILSISATDLTSRVRRAQRAHFAAIGLDGALE